ncbi:MAG: LLM class flavin-dependent oxidoreductase [Chloroflexaceae bacterium]|nr:LLM class flavin-dependent oxidoreductase [Chloroflexaceae bacterium]
MIRFGICPCVQSPPDGQHLQQRWQEALAEAQVADEAGFDLCVLTEHHQQSDGYFPNPLLAAAAVAAVTRRIYVGCAVSILTVHHPVQVAEDAFQLDVMSGGRLFLGLGSGYSADDYACYQVNMNHRPSLFEEALQILHQARTGAAIDFRGKRYTTGAVNVYPRPVQQPLPLYVGAWSVPGLERTARLADGWITDVVNTRPTLKGLAQIYREACATEGKKPEVLVMREGFCAATREAAQQRYEAAIVSSHRLYYQFGAYNRELEPWMAAVPSADQLTLEHIQADRFILGDPQECIAEIERYIAELGATTFILRMRHPDGPSHAETLESIRIFAEQVIPYFRERYGSA